MISLVVPTYKERANIERLVERTGAALAQCREEYELIIVDDGSPDGTGDEVLRLASDGRPWLRLLVRQNERDLSTAVIAGWRIARGDVFGCMDADLQHPPEMLPKLLAELRQTGAEIVVGSRHVPGGGVSDWSLARRFVSWTATLMATTILPGTLGKVTDPMSGFFLLRRSVLARAALNPVGYKILLEVLAKGDYTRVAEVPFVFEEREKGGSKMNAATVFKYLAHLLRISIESGEAVRMLKYGLVGLSGAAVNGAALWWLYRRAGWPLPAAAFAAAAVAIVNNFIWNETFTFAETRRARPGWTQALGRFISFVAFSGTGVAINVSIIWLLRSGFGAPLSLSALAGIGIAAVWNFLLNSNVTWLAWWDRKLLSRTACSPEPVEGSDLVWTPCALCGSREAHILFAGDAPRSLGSSKAARPGRFTNIVQCSQCGLLFVNPRIAAASDEGHRGPAAWAQEQNDASRSEVLRRLFTKLGRPAPAGPPPELGAENPARGAQPPGSLDVVTLWNSLERGSAPVELLRQAHRLLRPEGALVLRTTNSTAMFVRLAGRRWHGYSSGNLYFFTPGMLTQLLGDAGFEVVAIDKQGDRISVRELLERAAVLLGPLEPLVRLLGKPFGGVRTSADLGDTMSILAIKSTARPS